MNQEEFQEWTRLDTSALCFAIDELSKALKREYEMVAMLQEEVRVLKKRTENALGDIDTLIENADGMQEQLDDTGRDLTALNVALDELRNKVNGAQKPPHRRLINEKGEFYDAAGIPCTFRRPRRRHGIGELYIGSHGGGITLNYALIEELLPILQQFLYADSLPWEPRNQ